MSFRKFQTVLDLRSAASHLIGEIARELSTSEISIQQKITSSISDRVSNWKLGLSENDWASLISASCSPEVHRSEFLFATCVLLLDRFENPHRGSDFSWEWDEFGHHYRLAPNRIRAALMNGLEEARKGAIISEDIYPTPSDLTTNSPEDVIPPLIIMARALTREERALIARADYGSDIDKHLEALNALLETERCEFTDTWYPAEVVELVSHTPSEKCFIGCTALVLINAIYDGDGFGHASFRWNNNKHYYQSLESKSRKPIIAAFRHLYETLPDWAPFCDGAKFERLLLPWSVDQSVDTAIHL